MSIRKKTILITAATIAGVLVLLYVTSSAIVGRSFAQLEQESARLALFHVISAVRADIDALDATVTDWAAWDDTYAFVQNPSRRYAESNLTADSLAALRVAYMVFVDASGRIVFTRGINLDTREDAEVPPDLIAQLRPEGSLLRRSRAAGVLLAGGAPLLVAAEPILTSRKEGPPAGTLVFARPLSPAFLDALAARDDIALDTSPWKDDAPLDGSTALRQRLSQAGWALRPLDDNRIAAYGLLRDFGRRPALVVRAVMPRRIHARSQDTLLYLLAACFLVALVVGAANYLVFDRTALARLARLTHHLRGIANGPDASARVPAEGRDELSELARSINAVLSALEQAEREVRDSERRSRELSELLPAPVFETDADARLTYVNRAAYETFGYTEQDLQRGIHVLETLAPEERTRAAERLRTLFAGRPPEMSEYTALRKDGSRFPVAIHCVRVLRDGKPIGLRGIVVDMTTQKRAEETIRQQALYDPLTQLPNRALLERRIEAALDQARRANHLVAILYLDLDRFKFINDTFGHALGDKLLRYIGARLKASLRAGDTVARVGGDEFVVLFPDIHDRRGAIAAARQAIRAVASPFDLDGAEVHITASGGLSLFPKDGDNAPVLLRKADAALYLAKERGRNRFHFYTARMDAESAGRLALENELRRALDQQQFVLRYQPQVEIDTGAIVGAEALLQWQHPQRGLVSAADFIEVAADCALIDPLGDWVLREACLQAAQWEREYPGDPPLRVWVNLSAREFHRDDLPDRVAEALAAARLGADRLGLEIAETAAMRSVEASISLMRKLRAQGIMLALDDFGLGHSSLVDLKRLPVDVLKIDQSFIRDLVGSASDRAIVEAVIAMARSLGFKVVAEGVECEEQLAFLRARGCWGIQGYLHSRPAPPEAIADLLRAGRTHAAPSR